ncbi:putative plant self-incompatibility S1 [Helianthus anomalus]
MKLLSKWCFFLYLMLHFSIIVKGFEHSSISKTPPSSKFFEPYRVYITNFDIPFVIYHCDIPSPGLLLPGNTFTWKFRRNLFETNRYHCWFSQLQSTTLKKIELNVFDKEVAMMCGRNLFHMNRCYWLLTQSGMYFSKNNETFQNGADDNWRFMYGWN